jgi:protein-S-isoprenylcysteine O-methyltransferase Ste14
LLFFGCLILGWGLGLLRPFPTGLPGAFRFTGGALLWLSGAVLGLWGVLTFKRRGTTHEPNGVATVLLTDGPFRFSRNPLYLALTALLAAFGLVLDSTWVLLLVPVLVLLLDRLVIAREEVRLRAQFGVHYRNYSRSVRRWL